MPKTITSFAKRGATRGDASEATTVARHVVITGPGRSGTTLLVKLLDRLGFETGSERLAFSAQARAGLETDVLGSDPPYVVKDPSLTWRLRGMLDAGDLDADRVEWLLVPLRSLDEVVASRVSRALEQRDVRARGGLVAPTQPAKQRQLLAEGTYSLLETAALYELPLITLEYPRFAADVDYAFRRLSALLTERGISRDAFGSAWTAVVEPGLVNGRTARMAPWAGVRIALLRLRRWCSLKLTAVRRALALR